MLHENKYKRFSREQDAIEKVSHFCLILLKTKQTLNIAYLVDQIWVTFPSNEYLAKLCMEYFGRLIFSLCLESKAFIKNKIQYLIYDPFSLLSVW